jgi:benzodiazapine receptor
LLSLLSLLATRYPCHTQNTNTFSSFSPHSLAVGLPVGLGMLSGLVSSPRSGDKTKAWYKSMVSPPFSAPSAVFPAAWTVLYAAMGYASHINAMAFDAAVTPAQT